MPADDMSSFRADEADPTRADDLERLVSEWLTVPDAASLQGVPLSTVRRQIKDRELLSVRRGPGGAVAIPAAFVTPQGVRPELRGTFTVLVDGGMSDAEAIAWLFTPDDTLPVPGTPMDAIVAGHKTEIRRRAMEAAL